MPSGDDTTTQLVRYARRPEAFVFVPVILVVLYAARAKVAVIETIGYYLIGGVLIAAVLMGAMYDLLLLCYVAGKAALALLELGVLLWGLRPWRASRAQQARVAAARLLADSNAAAPSFNWGTHLTAGKCGRRGQGPAPAVHSGL